MDRTMKQFWSWRVVRAAHQPERTECHATGNVETVKMVIFVLCSFCHNYLKVLNTHTPTHRNKMTHEADLDVPVGEK